MLVFDLFGNRFTAAGAWDTILLWLTSGDAENIILGLAALALAVVFVGGIVALSLWRPAHGMMLLVALWLMGFIDRNPTSYYGVRMSAVDAALLINRLGGDVDPPAEVTSSTIRAFARMGGALWCPEDLLMYQNVACQTKNNVAAIHKTLEELIGGIQKEHPTIPRSKIVRLFEKRVFKHSNGSTSLADELRALDFDVKVPAAPPTDRGYISLDEMGWPDANNGASAPTSEPPGKPQGLSFEEFMKP